MKRADFNEYGIALDSNGYAPSIVQSDTTMCFRCHKKSGKLDRHEIWGGVANRQKCKQLGLWVTLCHSTCHEGRMGVHQNGAEMEYMHRVGQQAAMEAYGWTVDEFIRRIGKNYL